MGKYFISAKQEAQGTSESDIQNPLQVTEIATELVITRLYCIMLLKEGTLQKSDTIVTTEERKCLYENIFDNVITWNEFKKLKIPKTQVIDPLAPSLFDRLAAGKVDDRLIPYTPFYKNWERDKQEIQNINLSSLEDYDLTSEFICLLIRTRKAWSYKNLQEEYWREVIELLEKRGKKVLVFGKEVEKYATPLTQYVKNFKDWCSVINHENCKHVVSTISGGVYPVFLLGKKERTLTIIDNLNFLQNYGYDPSCYNDCINFTGVSKNILNYLPTPSQLAEILIKE